MPLTYGPSVNYPSPLIAIPSTINPVPTEGRYQVPIEILWTSMGGTAKTIGFDVRETGPEDALQQIASVVVDNSECAVAVTLIFPDTSERVVIPANTKRAAVNVYTNGTSFVAVAAGAGAADVTRLQVLNYRTPSIYIP